MTTDPFDGLAVDSEAAQPRAAQLLRWYQLWYASEMDRDGYGVRSFPVGMAAVVAKATLLFHCAGSTRVPNRRLEIGKWQVGPEGRHCRAMS